MPTIDVTAAAQQATHRARLVETVLFDRLVERAAADAEHKPFGPKGRPGTAIVWTKDLPGALIGNEHYRGRAGQLHLVDPGAAQVLKDAGYAEIRESLRLPPSRSHQAAVAADLRQTAEDLQQTAEELLAFADQLPDVTDEQAAQMGVRVDASAEADSGGGGI